MAKIKTLFFDLDNTLIHSDLAYEEGLKAIGYSSAHPEYLEARAKAKSQLPKNHVGSHNRWLYFKVLLEGKKQLSPQRIIELAQTYETAMVQSIGDQWVSLKRESFFLELKKDFRLAIITNETLRTQMLKLNAMDPNGVLFERVIVSEEAGTEKPSLEIYQHACRSMQVSPQECVMVGDDYENDVVGAKNAGMAALWVCQFSPQKANPDALSNLADIAERLKAMTSTP